MSYDGPFEVIRKLSPVTYQIRLPTSYGMHPIINVAHLEKYNVSPEEFGEQPKKHLNRADFEDLPEEEVEQILCPTLDIEMVRLIRPELTQVGILRDRFTCTIFILPYRVQNSEGTVDVGPMDRVVERVLNRQQGPAAVFFVANDVAADSTLLPEQDHITVSVSDSSNSSRASSLAPASPSSSDSNSSTLSGGTTFLY
ncbi:hypothetical protein C8R46DRAFT_1227642 [Mycena filopes]|nr:hypothetical protein C8R46DRAFT_1227642 [Mycena filopes]